MKPLRAWAIVAKGKPVKLMLGARTSASWVPLLYGPKAKFVRVLVSEVKRARKANGK